MEKVKEIIEKYKRVQKTIKQNYKNAVVYDIYESVINDLESLLPLIDFSRKEIKIILIHEKTVIRKVTLKQIQPDIIHNLTVHSFLATSNLSKYVHVKKEKQHNGDLLIECSMEILKTPRDKTK